MSKANFLQSLLGLLAPAFSIVGALMLINRWRFQDIYIRPVGWSLVEILLVSWLVGSLAGSLISVWVWRKTSSDEVRALAKGGVAGFVFAASAAFYYANNYFINF